MITLVTIKKLVQKEFKIKNIGTKNRLRHIVHARWVYFKLAKDYTTHSLSSIGLEVNRDHATVLHGLKYIDYDLKQVQFQHIKEIYEKLNSFISSGKRFVPDEKLVDLQEIKNHIKNLESRIKLLEYESKQNNLVKNKS